VNSIDALKMVRYVVGLSYSQSEPCENIGHVVPTGHQQGDVDCNSLVDAVDALKVLRHAAGLSVLQNEPCPDIGT
jgi:hypothetical protein